MGMSEHRYENTVTNIPQYEIMEKSLTNENFPLVLFSGSSNSFCVGIVDIVNSTKISASLNYDKFSKYYSFFLNTMSKIAKKCNAKVVKNIGDSLLFYFPNSSNVNNSSYECLTCCLALVEYHNNLNEILRKQDLPKLDYRVSADFGQIMIANSENSHQEDIFGSPVNMVSKINRNAKPNQVVIGGDLYELVKKFTKFSFKQVHGYNIGLKIAYPSYIVDFKKGSSLNQVKTKKEFDSQLFTARSITVATAIERAIKKFGTPELELITTKLSSKYHSYIFDCYKKPEYLKNILKSLYGNAYHSIIGMIEVELNAITSDKDYHRFLDVLRD